MMNTRFGKRLFILIACILMISAFCFGCGRAVPAANEETAVSPSADPSASDSSASKTNESEINELENNSESTQEDFSDAELIRGEAAFDPEKKENFLTDQQVLFDMASQDMRLLCTLKQIPASDDTEIYFFAINPYENPSVLEKDPLVSGRKGHTIEVFVDYYRKYLFTRFVPAIKLHGKYVPIADGKYIDNPDLLAMNRSPYPDIPSIKGLLIDPATIGTEKLTDLGLSQAIYNIPLSQIIGESTNPDLPTIEFEYDDEIFHFNTDVILAYDGLFKYLESNQIYTTAIILNDWNEANPELIHPLSREKTKKSLYYAFNTEEKEGVRLMEATALFLAERYSNSEHGMVYNWVIANEINQHTVWNYMNTTDLDLYCDSFERAFRIFYNAIKSCHASAGVYYSIDHDWNDNGDDNSKWFNGKELVTIFNEKARKYGNYDWGLAIHPYPNPLTRVNYWSENNDMTPDAEVLTLMNLSSLTKLLEQDEFRTNAGEVRSVTVTELGFTSYAGEKLQAAAFAYCYYILEANPYIDAFMLNRQTDAWEEMQAGLAFGLYNPDLTDKYALEVFKNVDTDERKQYEDIVLNILGAESMEEALSWAVPKE